MSDTLIGTSRTYGRITTEYRGCDWIAYLDGDRRIWEAGKTENDAIAYLVKFRCTKHEVDALREIEGFARRNDERARKALEAISSTSKKIFQPRAMIEAEAEARYHEAHRIYLVIQARVQEALT